MINILKNAFLETFKSDSNIINFHCCILGRKNKMKDSLYEKKMFFRSSRLILGLIIVVAAFAFLALTAKAINVPDDYPTIQEAIDAANPGDTVNVAAGTYYENVKIYKTINLIGENRDTTVIDGGGTDNTVYITADWVNLSGFTIQNSGVKYRAGIYIKSSYNNITNNIIFNNTYPDTRGINIYYPGVNNNITNNIVSNNSEAGIYLYYSGGNTIADNVVLNNSDTGIYLSNSWSNIFTGNTVSDNSYGIYLSESWNTIMNSNSMLGNKYNFGVSGSLLGHYIQNIDTSNTVDGKPIYYWVNENGGSIPSDAGFVGLINSSQVIVENLNIVNNHIGVLFYNTTYSTISNISASNNWYGIALYYSNFNTIIDNNISSNGFGIGLAYSSSNNNITNNIINSNIYDGIRLHLDNSNNNISGNIMSNNYIRLYFSNNNIITNNTISPLLAQKGIHLHWSNNNTVTNNNISNSTAGYGILLQSASNNTISSNNVSKIDSTGICLFWYSSNNTITDNNILNNRAGLHLLAGCTDNIISGNNFSMNGKYALYIELSHGRPCDNNLIYNNYFNNVLNYNAGDECSNIWNISKTQGENIIGGPYLGGNYWSNYMGVDEDGDGLGDTLLPYGNTGDIINGGDFLPLTEVEMVQECISAVVDITPDTIKLGAGGKYITSYIELPVGYDVNDIVISSILLNGVVPALDSPTDIGDYDNDFISDLMVKFDRAAVTAILSPGASVPITITGELIDGTCFEGTDYTKVKT